MQRSNSRHPLLPAGPVALLLTAILIGAVAVSLIAAPGENGVFGALLAAIMLAIARTDAQRFIIPNELTAGAFALALLHAALAGPAPGWSDVLLALARAAATAVPLYLLMQGYRMLRGREGLGLGDVKLAAVAGAWLDWLTIIAVIELAAIAAIAAYVARGVITGRPLTRATIMPFGLFLAPAIWLGWLFEALLF